MKIEIRWEISDGYIGKSRPQYSSIDSDDLDDFDTETEVANYIEEIIREDFNQQISWSIESGMEKAMAAWRMLKKVQP